MLDKKVILITGSSRGIGAATAKLAAKYGARVVLHGRTDSAELRNLAIELSAPFILCDISDKKAVQKEIDRIIKEVGRIDGLVNNAGFANPKAFLETEDEDWVENFKINLMGTVHFCQAVIPFMQNKKYGRIVNIASSRGHLVTANAKNMTYSVAKAGVINLTAALAKEYAPNILVNAVSPSFTLTDMSNTWSDEIREKVKTNLVGRAAEPEEIAEVILFLISDKNSFMTGQTLLVDGGYSIAGK